MTETTLTAMHELDIYETIDHPVSFDGIELEELPIKEFSQLLGKSCLISNLSWECIGSPPLYAVKITLEPLPKYLMFAPARRGWFSRFFAWLRRWV